MKSVAALATMALFAAAPLAATAPSAVAASSPKTYGNCTQLNKAYPHGVRVSSRTVDHTTRGTRASKATVNAKLYQANKRLDRDRDGIACEK